MNFDNIINTSGFGTDPIQNFAGGQTYSAVPKIVNATVSLGAGQNQFIFLDTEIPQNLPVGGIQVSTLHEFFGGARTVDVYGFQPKQLELAGTLLSLDPRSLPPTGNAGPRTQLAYTAKERAQQLLKLWADGNQLTFAFGEITYDIVIHHCDVNIRHDNLADYTLICHVISSNILDFLPSDKRNQQTNVSPFTNIASQLATIAKKAALVTQLAILATTAAKAVYDNLQKDPGAILLAGVSCLPGSAAFFTVKTALAEARNAMDYFTGTSHPTTMVALGAAQPFETLSNDAIKGDLIPQLKTNIDTTQKITNYHLNTYSLLNVADPNITGQMATDMYAYLCALKQLVKHLETLVQPSKNRQLALYNPNLYKLATQFYRDSNQWNVIADANNLDKPILSGFYNIKIPVLNDLPVTSNIIAANNG